MVRKKIAKAKTEKSYQKIVIGFMVVTVVVVVLIVYFSFSKTIISITPNDETISTDFVVSVKESLTEEDNDQLNILLGSFLQTEVADSLIFTDIQAGADIEDFAEGTITVINNYGSAQPLQETTRFLSEGGLLFRTTEFVTVPAGGTADIPVKADVKGVTYNIEPGRFTIPGLWPGLQDDIYGESQEAMKGGIKQAKAVTAENIITAQQQLENSLLSQALADLQTQVKSTEAITASGTYTQKLIDEVDAEVGDEVDSFTANLKLRVTSLAFSQDTLLSLALENLRKRIPSDKGLYDYGIDNLQYSVDTLDFDNKVATLKIHFSGSVLIKMSSSIFDRANIINKDKQEIQAYFANFDEVKEVKIRFSPFWVFRAPALEDHIEIRLVELE
ncbi:baseplate J/gp47 family protein [Patescibacteria group bacterium]|nr:baseplate J/gp47 family protein [Patescibacteria group bacterium]